MISIETLIITLIVSLVAGTLASLVMHQRNTLLGNIILGFCGTLLGDFIVQVLNLGQWGLIPEIVVATLCAILLIWLWRQFVSGTRRSYRKSRSSGSSRRKKRR
jgi:uncharacterized membrane protein YeaQ/YmgE (transglycosylase-associated protein family)